MLGAVFMPEFVLHPLAVRDITEIWEYTAYDNVTAAGRLREEIYSRIESLVRIPTQGRKRPDLTSRPLRFVQVGEYLIAYAPDEKPLFVIAVVHARRNPRVMAAILRGRE